MALTVEATKKIHEQRMNRMLGLLKSRATNLMEKLLNEQHRSLSHYSKDQQYILAAEAEIALMDRMIIWLNKG